MSELSDKIVQLVEEALKSDKLVIILPTKTQQLVMGSVFEGEADARLETNARGQTALHLRLPRGKDSVIPGPKGERGEQGEPGADGRPGLDSAFTESARKEFESSVEARLQEMKTATVLHDLEKSVAAMVKGIS